MSRRIEVSAAHSEHIQLHKEIAETAGKVLLTKVLDHPAALLVQKNRLLGMRFLEDASRIGMVTIGRVTDVKENIGACFVQFLEGETGFLSLKNVPKEYLPLHQTNLIPVELIADAQKGKHASLTARVNWKKIKNGAQIREQARHFSAYTVLKEARLPAVAALREMARPEEYEEIITDDPGLAAEVQSYAASIQRPVRLYEDASFSLRMLYGLDTKADTAIADRVWLSCGGNLVFNYTEALTVIDVNSGKYEPSKGMTREEYIQKVNLEAGEEILLQLRLRNLSGMILVDFLNVSTEEEKANLLQMMAEGAEKDLSPLKVIDITPLGIMELTRKKAQKSLREQFTDLTKTVIKDMTDNEEMTEE